MIINTRVSKPYHAPKNDFVLFEDAILRVLPLLLRDRPHQQAKGMIRNYFEKGYVVFHDHVESLKQPRRLSAQEEQQLRFMLDALISAKQMLEEKE